MTLRETLDQAYNSMSLAWSDMFDELVIIVNDWAWDNRIEINPRQEVLRYLRGK